LLKRSYDASDTGVGDLCLKQGYDQDQDSNTEASDQSTDVQHSDCFGSSLEDAANQEQD